MFEGDRLVIDADVCLFVLMMGQQCISAALMADAIACDCGFAVDRDMMM